MLLKKKIFMIILICFLLISCSKSTNSSKSEVEGVSVSPALIYTTSGNTLNLYARVYGKNLDDYSTSWSITGQIADTFIDTNGLLTIDKYETAPTIYAVATSNFDKKSNARSIVNIVQNDIYAEPDFSESEYVFDMYFFDFLSGTGWIYGRIEYNSNDLVRPPIDPIVNMFIDGAEINVELSWLVHYYNLSIRGVQYYYGGQNISIEIITTNGTALWETTIPHKPQFVNVHGDIDYLSNSYYLHDDINITWEATNISMYQRLYLYDRWRRVSVSLPLMNYVRNFTIPSTSHDLEGVVSFQDMSIQNIAYTIIDNIAFKIRNEDDRSYVTIDDL